ncbi:hypothetical protein CF328_g5592, partial [Tilletia controversa]
VQLINPTPIHSSRVLDASRPVAPVRQTRPAQPLRSLARTASAARRSYSAAAVSDIPSSTSPYSTRPALYIFLDVTGDMDILAVHVPSVEELKTELVPTRHRRGSATQ